MLEKWSRGKYSSERQPLNDNREDDLSLQFLRQSVFENDRQRCNRIGGDNQRPEQERDCRKNIQWPSLKLSSQA